MTSKEILENIKLRLSLDSKKSASIVTTQKHAAIVTLKDGTTAQADELAPGNTFYLNDADGNGTAAPEGTYLTEDGTGIRVEGTGKIAEIMASTAAQEVTDEPQVEEMAADAPTVEVDEKVEDVKKLMEAIMNISDRLAALEAKSTEMGTKMASHSEVLAKFSAQPAAKKASTASAEEAIVETPNGTVTREQRIHSMKMMIANQAQK